MSYDKAIMNLPDPIFAIMKAVPSSSKNKITEIRLRLGHPLAVTILNKTFFVSKDSTITDNYKFANLVITQDNIEQTLQKASDYCMYSHSNDIKNGFITTKEGARVGICGQAVIENGEVTNITNVSSLNIRVPHEIIGLSDIFFSEIYQKNSVLNTLIIGKPLSGKTTLIRDIARALCRKNVRICIIDERNEIAAMQKGRTSYEIGSSCDVLSGFPKAVGFECSLKSMAPEVIICDEISDKHSCKAIKNIINCGVKIIATVHAENIDELNINKHLRKLLKNNAFTHIINLNEKID